MVEDINAANTDGGQQYWREADARVWVDAWRESGQTRADFARTHGIKVERLSRWARRLSIRAEAQDSAAFHPVRVRLPQAMREGDERIELELADGCRIRLPHGFDAVDLRQVLDVLDASARC
jgi:hypothetical protein